MGSPCWRPAAGIGLFSSLLVTDISPRLFNSTRLYRSKSFLSISYLVCRDRGNLRLECDHINVEFLDSRRPRSGDRALQFSSARCSHAHWGLSMRAPATLRILPGTTIGRNRPIIPPSTRLQPRGNIATRLRGTSRGRGTCPPSASY